MQYSLTFKKINRDVQQLTIDLDAKDSSGRISQARAVFYIFNTGDQYPTELLHESQVADLWLVQEELDECLQKYPGQRVWLDNFEKTKNFKTCASLELARILQKEKETLYSKGIFEVFLNPHPIGGFSDQEEKDLKSKIISKYEEHLHIQKISDNIYMFKI